MGHASIRQMRHPSSGAAKKKKHFGLSRNTNRSNFSLQIQAKRNKMFTRWNWKQAGIHYHTKPKTSERRIQKDRERITKYNQTKRMEFEDNTRKYWV